MLCYISTSKFHTATNQIAKGVHHKQEFKGHNERSIKNDCIAEYQICMELPENVHVEYIKIYWKLFTSYIKYINEFDERVVFCFVLLWYQPIWPIPLQTYFTEWFQSYNYPNFKGTNGTTLKDVAVSTIRKVFTSTANGHFWALRPFVSLQVIYSKLNYIY